MKLEITKIDLFKGKQIRKVIFKNEWWFSITDVLTGRIMGKLKENLRSSILKLVTPPFSGDQWLMPNLS